MSQPDILSFSQHAHEPQCEPRQPVPFIDLREQHQTIRDDVMQAVTRVFDSQHFILGDELSRFETECASYCDSLDAIGCASGSDALLLALMALGVGPGDEVITSPFSFFATAGSIDRVGAKPVFVDIRPQTFNMNPDLVADAVTPATKAIMPVHLFGQCVEMEPLWRIAVRHGLPIIEDAAQALGARYRGRRAGVLGTIGCFSFFPTKNLGAAGDGGLMTTDDPDLSARLRRLRVHGDVGGYQHVEAGINSRLDALQAAVLSVKLKHLDDWSRARAANAARYTAGIEERGLAEFVQPPPVAPDREHVFNQYCIRIADGMRDAVAASLKQQNVGCAVYYPKPLHLQPCFERWGYREGDLPEAERAASEILALPIYPELGESRQQIVLDTLTEAVAAARWSAQRGDAARKAA